MSRRKPSKFTFRIKQLNYQDIRPDSTILCVAPRGGGKSTQIKEIMYHLRTKFYGGMVISPSEEMNQFFSKFVPENNIKYKFDEKDIKILMERQRAMIKKKTARPDAFLIMDDCLEKKRKFEDIDAVRSIWVNGRHFKILSILALQYLKAAGPLIRQNTTWLFMGALHEKDSKDIYELVAHIFPSYSVFKETLRRYTQKKHFMVVRLLGTDDWQSDCSSELESDYDEDYITEQRVNNNVFYTKAKRDRDFKLLPSECWRKTYSDPNNTVHTKSETITYEAPRIRPKKIELPSKPSSKAFERDLKDLNERFKKVTLK